MVVDANHQVEKLQKMITTTFMSKQIRMCLLELFVFVTRDRTMKRGGLDVLDDNIIIPSDQYSKNPWPMGIHTILNEVGLVGREPTRPKAKSVLGPPDPPNSDCSKFSMARASCFYPTTTFFMIRDH